ncbi:hypothetical protein CASFOL_019044 [Castilleja foliolosa]|uniref:RNase H type-1 domain-containing protein n=1 Tax=Castilleja foliolosa TaxID=1961234 RepID=A0ABD3D735_9LAMI
MVESVTSSCRAHWTSLAQSNLGSISTAKNWKPPPPQWMAVSVDAAFSNGTAFTSLVFRNADGSIFYTSANKHNCLDLVSAENLAILDACKEIEKAGFQKARIDSDCSNAITIINLNFANGYWSAAPVIEKNQAVQAQMEKLDF